MMKIIVIPIFITLCLLSINSVKSIEFVFCVADPNPAHGPGGFACKDPSKVTTDDFVYSGLSTPGNSGTLMTAHASNAFVNEFHGLNGLGISMTRADIDVGGAMPIHFHRVSELLLVVEGTVGVGILASDNKAYYNVMEKGDIIALPPSLEHFVVNLGKVPSVLRGSFPSSYPGAHVMPFTFFGNDLPTEILEKATMFDGEQIKKLKKTLGGTN